MLFNLPKNKNVRKTIFNVVAIYLTTTILLVLSIAITYSNTQKQKDLLWAKKELKIQADFIISTLELLHNNIEYELAFYPRFEN